MRRIIVSLFAISAIVGVGVFATGAYFTDSITQDNYTFTTGTADLKMAFCGPIGTDCLGTTASLDNVTFSSPAQDQRTGPGMGGAECIVIENTGDYALALSSQVFVTSQTNGNMDNFFQIRTDPANSNCNPTATGTWQSAQDADAAGSVPSGITLAPQGRLYVITRNQWDSTGNQDALQGQTLKLKTVIEGRTV